MVSVIRVFGGYVGMFPSIRIRIYSRHILYRVKVMKVMIMLRTVKNSEKEEEEGRP